MKRLAARQGQGVVVSEGRTTLVINKYLAETVGTYILVGVGSMAILAVTATEGPLVVAWAFAFGLALLAGIYAVGDVSGGHFNPAVTLAAFLDKRVDFTDLVGYWIGQIVGALLASLTVLAVAQQAGVQGTYTRLGAGVEAWEGFLVEAVLTAIFVLVILTATKRAAATAGLAISLTLVAIHLAAIPFTGASVNPARSFAPAVIGNDAPDLWVYILAPLVGAVVGWALFRLFHADALAE
jgi:aquaporin Z